MFRGTSSFDKLLEKATSHLKLDPDWPVILQICDLIRQGDVQPKYALGAIKKKMINPNPHVGGFALDVLESCVKNCGSLIHDEIGSKGYMEQLRETIKLLPTGNVKSKLLELIQAWAYAFRNIPKYRAVQDTVNIMKAEGYTFPALKESDAMFAADSAPVWEDGDRCHRCRVQFFLLTRKHHCRACGQVFCGQCSSKFCTLPKLGFEKEVRVCDACHENVNKPSTATSKTDDLPVEYLNSSLAQQSQAPPPRKSEAELKEEEELQLAIALSQSEAEQKSKIGTNRNTSASITVTTRPKSYSPPPKKTSSETRALEEIKSQSVRPAEKVVDGGKIPESHFRGPINSLSTSPEADPDLARYLNRSYWQQQNADYSNASAPVLSATPTPPKQTVVPEQNGVEESEMEEFVAALQSQVEIFVNRMKSNSSRGRSIANDSSVETLFMNITAMHSKLLRYIQQQDDKRVYFEGLQDKLAQVKDARAALDALRDEHREKLRREAEIAERQRQLQMAQKLDIMRKKKQEYLQYQRQLALQHIQEQEREMQIRQEQQKQQYLMGSQYAATLPYMRPGPGYDMAGRYPNPPPQSAPPFTHFPAPGATSMHLDGTMTPGGPMMMNQPRPSAEQQGLIMRQPGMMPPTGMVPQNMMPLGPQGGTLPPYLHMMGQRTPGPGQPGPMPPQSFNGPPSLPQPLQNPLPNMSIPQSVPGSAPLSGSQTLPRPSGQSSLGQQQGLQGPPQPQPLPGQPSMGNGPQSFPDQPVMNGPQSIQGHLTMNNQPPHQGQQLGVAPGVQSQPSMNGPQAPLPGPQSLPGMVVPGMPLGNQPMLPSHPQNSLPPHMVAQNMPPMMPPGQQQIGPSMPQQQFQQPPSQPQNEDKTAELISFD